MPTIMINPLDDVENTAVMASSKIARAGGSDRRRRQAMPRLTDMEEPKGNHPLPNLAPERVVRCKQELN
jgi:hypothetical protein